MGSTPKNKPKSNGKHPGGRPPKYDPKIHPELVYYMALNGDSDIKIAKNLQIDKATLYRWIADRQEFCDKYKQGWRDYYSPKIERSLAKRAIGYTVIEEVVENAGNEENQRKRVIKKHIPADPTAIKYYLNNRNPKEWKDRSEVGLSADGITITLDPGFLADGNKKNQPKS